jgi:glycosyltransferase
MPPHPTFFVRKEVYVKCGTFDTRFTSAADYELMLRFLFRNKVSSVYVPEIIVSMRVGGKSNQSIANRVHANNEDRKAWEVNGLKPYPFTILLKPIRKIPQFILSKFIKHR